MTPGRPRFAMLLLLLLGACRSAAPPPVGVVEQPTPTRPPCPRAIDGLDALVRPGAMLVLGEVHGTAESPRFVGDVAYAAGRTAPVTVGLEIPRDEQPRIDGFLASPGGERDLTALLDGGFWRRADQDGRSSEAMLALLESLRATRAAGADVGVLAFDLTTGAPTDARDREMAIALAAARRRAPDRTLVVLTGNLHSRRRLGAPWDPGFEPMTWFLVEQGVALVTLDVRLDGGGAWVCMMEDDGAMTCGASDAPADAVDRTWYVDLTPTETHHDGYYIVGPTTASVPAVH